MLIILSKGLRVYKVQNNKIYLKIKVQPNSSKNKIAGLYGEALKVNIKAPAVEGAANKELIKFLSKEFKVAKSDIELKNPTSKQKEIILPYSKETEEKIKGYLN
ncbi:MAG: YggU family protein [Epsilonproteobacteria bacterium]|nr:YggU family protein [Campylobacterota bacterium]